MLITDQKLLNSIDSKLRSGKAKILRAVLRDDTAVWVVDLAQVRGVCFVPMSCRYEWSKWVGRRSAEVTLKRNLKPTVTINTNN
jgi:hypothetical protein